MLTKSDARKSSSTSVVTATLGFPASAWESGREEDDDDSRPFSLPPEEEGRRLMIIFIPRTSAISATLVPIRPDPPTRPSVLPLSSIKGSVKGPVKLDRSLLALSISCCLKRFMAKFMTYVIAVCATASVLYVGMLQTAMPFSRQVSMGTLLYPVPASQIKRTELENRSTAAGGSCISLSIRISVPAWTSLTNRTISSTMDPASVLAAAASASLCSVVVFAFACGVFLVIGTGRMASTLLRRKSVI
mmetsp:Transcript_16898/g.36911  ORF Transcript_16898/g.36911 Transcript_16898/m.36911 type:complete len:246 (-) Transcript_16898:389-1126(-)